MSLTTVEIGQRVRRTGATPLRQKVEIFAILGATFPAPGTNWREILHGKADPPLNCQILHESVQRVVPVE